MKPEALEKPSKQRLRKKFTYGTSNNVVENIDIFFMEHGIFLAGGTSKGANKKLLDEMLEDAAEFGDNFVAWCKDNVECNSHDKYVVSHISWQGLDCSYRIFLDNKMHLELAKQEGVNCKNCDKLRDLLSRSSEWLEEYEQVSTNIIGTGLAKEISEILNSKGSK